MRDFVLILGEEYQQAFQVVDGVTINSYFYPGHEEKVVQFLEMHPGGVEALRESAELPGYHLGGDYTRPIAMVIPNIRETRTGANLLGLDARLQGASGEWGAAMRDIEAGEELTHDWATTDDDRYEMACRCGAACCRGTITGQDWRRPDLQEKYRGYFSWYLERRIDRGEGQ